MTTDDRTAPPAESSSQREWHIARAPDSARTARAAVRAFLNDAGPPGTAVETTTLVVSELVSNAVMHSRASSDIGLRVALHGGTVHVEVHDDDPNPPQPRRATAEASGGRGLQIVEQMAQRWGWQELTANGKRVWCDIASPKAAGS